MYKPEIYTIFALGFIVLMCSICRSQRTQLLGVCSYLSSCGCLDLTQAMGLISSHFFKYAVSVKRSLIAGHPRLTTSWCTGACDQCYNEQGYAGLFGFFPHMPPDFISLAIYPNPQGQLGHRVVWFPHVLHCLTSLSSMQRLLSSLFLGALL